MKVCIDARSPGYSGVLTYASGLLRGLAALDRGHQYVLLRTPKDKPWNLPDFEERVLPSSNPLHWYLWSNTSLVRMLEREGFDVYHSLKHITLLRGKTKKVVTFHSARFLIHPEHYKWYDAAYWKILSPQAARRYDAVIAVSEAERRNYVERMGAPADKFRVINLATDSRFRVIRDRNRLEAVRTKFGLPEQLILYVGRLLPVKNLETVLHGYREARRQGVTHKLVLVGRESWHSTSLQSLSKELGIANHVLFPGPIFEELPEVYNLADLFLLMSHYEAFPSVPLEAMASGTPVIASERGGLPDVVGQAGVITPADDAAQLGERIAEILGSEETLRSLRERGLKRCREFSWEETARRTAELYEELAGS